MIDFSKAFSERKDFFESQLSNLIQHGLLGVAEFQSEKSLIKAMNYSLEGGGKRFRPALAFFVAESLGLPPQRVLGWAMAIEFIHTYSLIHDDLPCLDNDDFRRGQPTNHKVFGESVALLAGDALLTDAFGLLARFYPQETGRLVGVLVEAAGSAGMVKGQVMDMALKSEKKTKEEYLKAQELKTAALIRATCEGAAFLCHVPDSTVLRFRQFGTHLGLAFQLADDLIDSKEKVEPGSLPALVGLDGTKTLLLEQSNAARNQLRELGISSGLLVDLVEYNLNRSA